MRFQKNIAFLFGVIALITYFSMRNLADEEIPVMKQNNQTSDVYLLKEGLLVPMQIPIKQEKEPYIKEYIDYMIGKKKIKNASSFSCESLQLLSMDIKNKQIILQFNSALLDIKKEEELLFIQSLIQMLKPLKDIDTLQIKVHQQTLKYLSHGTKIPDNIKEYQAINTFVNEGVLLHQSESLIVYRLLTEGKQTYYVPVELRIPKGVSIKEKLRYILSKSNYHSLLHSPMKDEYFQYDNKKIDIQGRKIKDEKTREQILNIIQLSCEANQIKISINEYGKEVQWEKTPINTAEFS